MLHQSFPDLRLVSKVTLLHHSKPDTLVRNHSAKGDLTMQDAYNFKKPHYPKIPWAKCIWSKDIPPSKSLLDWRMMLNKLPTDENLSVRGYNLPSKCSLCFSHVETTHHLFFECSFVVNIWIWLATTLNCPFLFSSIENIWTLCNRQMSSQCKITTTPVLINFFNVIWYARNQSRFKDKKIH